jgi:hypothetical protein
MSLAFRLEPIGLEAAQGAGVDARGHRQPSPDARRCLTSVDRLFSMRVSAAEHPQRDCVTSGCSRACTVPTATARRWSARARPGQASHGPGAASDAGRVAPSGWPRALQAQRLRANHRGASWLARRVAVVLPPGCGTSGPPRACQQEKTGPGAPARAPTTLPAPASRAGRGGQLPLCGTGATARAAVRAGRHVAVRAEHSAPPLGVARQGPPPGAGRGVCRRTPAGRRLAAAPTAVGTVGPHEVFPGWGGRLGAASRCRAAAGGPGADAAQRAPAPQRAAPAHTVHAAPTGLLHDRAQARARQWAVHPSLRIRVPPLICNQHL